MRLIALSSLACAAIALSGGVAARDPISIDALSRMPEIQSTSMSSDGKRIVALAWKEWRKAVLKNGTSSSAMNTRPSSFGTR